MAEKYKDFIGEDISNREVIKTSIKNIISTPKGTIPGKPELGSKLLDYVFSDLDELDVIDLEDYVNILISSNEKRVTRVKTKATFAPEYNRLIIKVEYQIIPEEETDFVSLTITV